MDILALLLVTAVVAGGGIWMLTPETGPAASSKRARTKASRGGADSRRYKATYLQRNQKERRQIHPWCIGGYVGNRRKHVQLSEN